MDIQLPIMDGYTATRKIKADPALRSIPIIAATSYALDGEEKKAREAGCDDYVSEALQPTSINGENPPILVLRKGNAPTRFHHSDRRISDSIAARFARAAEKLKVMRRIAALMPYSANDPQAQNRNGAFLQTSGSLIEAGQLVLELSDYSIQDIAQTVRSTLEPLAVDKKLGVQGLSCSCHRAVAMAAA
jgi:CheY-like chemotaxis protein